MNVDQRRALIKAVTALDKLDYIEEGPEHAHSEAEDILCEFLKSVGYGDAAEAFGHAALRCEFYA